MDALRGSLSPQTHGNPLPTECIRPAKAIIKTAPPSQWRRRPLSYRLPSREEREEGAAPSRTAGREWGANGDTPSPKPLPRGEGI